ncbi:hypothetical protein VTJ83DRAFT_7562 [Remersonia thermophila]|uniref:Extracellular serine-rich protein n=1 Tax=Remersonia thermophila TaxID=72144 RepID=A0ABR4D673_9PEZI
MLAQTFLAFLATAFTLTLAAPTATDPSSNLPTKTHARWRITHSVVAGRGGLRFDPDTIFAEKGSIIEFHFTPLNHSVAESSFSSPCVPKDANSFFSGFFPVARPADGSAVQSGEVFQIEVTDPNKPIWFYCPQNNGQHCQNGMVGVVNPKVDLGLSIREFRELASKVQGPSGVQPQVQGGLRIPNPNPLSGF